jgi:hypothetical protein
MRHIKTYKNLIGTYFAYFPDYPCPNTLFIKFYNKSITIRPNKRERITYNLLIEEIV